MDETFTGEPRDAPSKDRWGFALECANQGVWDADLVSGKTYYSPIWKQLLGYGPDELNDSGTLWLELIHPDDREIARNADLDHRLGRTPYFEAEFRMHHKDGHWVWIADRGRIVETDAIGRPTRMIGTHSDITARRQAEITTRASEERFRSIFALSPVGLAVIDCITQKFLMQSQSLCDLLGIPSAAFAGLTYSDLLSDNSDQVNDFAELLSSEWIYGPCEIELQHANGYGVPVIVTGSAIVESSGSFQLLLVFQDITQRRSYEERLWKLANLDTLTGLPNRMSFQARLGDALARADRSGRNVVLALFDIDHFKSVNDSLGHDVGDGLLKITSERVASAIRATDTLARLGGDEFAIILEDIGDDAGLTRPIDVVLDRIRSPVELAGATRNFTSSIGVGVYPSDGQDGTELLKAADMALYRAKELGRNRYEVFGPELRAVAQRQSCLRLEVDEALHYGELRARFEPIFSRDADNLEGIAVDVQMVHPTLGPLSREHLSVGSSDTNTSTALNAYRLEQALKCASDLQAAGYRFGRILIPLQPSLLRSEQFSRSFEEDLKRHGLSASVFEFSISEDATLSRGSELVISQMAKLTAIGIEFTLDQFGSGYASLTHLRRLPIAGVRFADSFVDGIESDGTDQAIVIGMVDLLHRIGLRACAQQVKTVRQADFLSGIGCDQLQGPYFSLPISLEELPHYLGDFRFWHRPTTSQAVLI